MSVTFGNLISSLAVKAGIAADDKSLIDILSKAELSSTNVPDNIASALQTNLFNEDYILNSSKYKNQFFAQALNGTDAEIQKYLEENGFDDDFKAPILQEKSTPKKVTLLANQIKALEEKRSQAASKDKPELTQEINKLREEKANLLKTHEENIQKIKQEHQAELTEAQKLFRLAGKNYANKDVDKEVNVEYAKLVLAKELEKKGAKLVTRDGKLTLVDAKDESRDFYLPDGTKPLVDDFIDGALAQNKLLAVSEPTVPVDNFGFNQGQPTHSPGTPRSVPSQNNLSAEYDKSLKDFLNGSHVAPQTVPV